MSNAVDLAKRYFALSNEGNLAEIRKLFRSSSTYSSANNELYLGADQIMQMQARFFAGYKSLHWEADRVEEVKPGIVLFDFSFSGKTLKGQVIARSGLETVIIYKGKIQHIEVKNKD